MIDFGPGPGRSIPLSPKPTSAVIGATGLDLGGWVMYPTTRSSVRLRLAVALEPRTVWGTGSRQRLGEATWRGYVVSAVHAANGRCEVCAGRSELHAEDVWVYDDQYLHRRFVRVACICDRCRAVRHFGLSAIQKRSGMAAAWFCHVNDVNEDVLADHLNHCARIWLWRSSQRWDTWFPELWRDADH